MSNPWEMLARSKKVNSLVSLFQGMGLTSELVRELDATDWLTAAKGAQVNPPSTATMLAVVAEMEAREKSAPKPQEAA